MAEVNPMGSVQTHHYAQNLCYMAKPSPDHKTLAPEIGAEQPAMHELGCPSKRVAHDHPTCQGTLE